MSMASFETLCVVAKKYVYEKSVVFLEHCGDYIKSVITNTTPQHSNLTCSSLNFCCQLSSRFVFVVVVFVEQSFSCAVTSSSSSNIMYSSDQMPILSSNVSVATTARFSFLGVGAVSSSLSSPFLVSVKLWVTTNPLEERHAAS